jgi:hypothetical protein
MKLLLLLLSSFCFAITPAQMQQAHLVYGINETGRQEISDCYWLWTQQGQRQTLFVSTNDEVSFTAAIEAPLKLTPSWLDRYEQTASFDGTVLVAKRKVRSLIPPGHQVRRIVVTLQDSQLKAAKSIQVFDYFENLLGRASQLIEFQCSL